MCCQEREVLNVKEVELFKAVDRWATKECEKEIRIAPCNGEGTRKRHQIGSLILTRAQDGCIDAT